MVAVYGVHDRWKDLFAAFRHLSETGQVPHGAKTPGHKDGWGIVIHDRGKPRYLGREPASPMNSSGYDRAVKEIEGVRPEIILAHLRRASCGGNLIENTQPFLDSQWSFAHNGTIYSPALVRTGTENDSTVYFRTLVAHLPNSDIENALASAVKRIRGNVTNRRDDSGRTYSSLTCLLSNGKSIYAIRDFLDEADHDYYTMYYRPSQDGIVFCQEKIIDGTWEEIPNKTLAAFHPGENVRIVNCN